MSSHLDSDYYIRLYEKLSLCRQFELLVAKFAEHGIIKSPVYLSVGQEIIPAILSEHPIITSLTYKPAIFAQHRAHSWFLCFGGNPHELMEQIVGMRGSASISNNKIRMYGHSGLLGDQIPIAVGYAHATKELVICVLGDAAAEEDYCLGALGYAATHKCRVLFIVEDNDLSILTKKKERRSWSITDVAQSMGISSFDIKPLELNHLMTTCIQYYFPRLYNIQVDRHLWHCGTGRDSNDYKDPLNDIKKTIGPLYAKLIEEKVEVIINDIARNYQKSN